MDADDLADGGNTNTAEAGANDGSQHTSTEGLDSAELAKQLAQKDEYIAKLQGTQGTLLQKLDATAERLVSLEGRLGEQRDILEGRSAKGDPAPDPWTIDDATREQFQNSPDKIVDFTRDTIRKTMSGLVGEISRVLEARDASIEQKLGGIQSLMQAQDPERRAWKGAVDELRKDESFADLPEEKLIAIAKRTNMKPDYEFTGGPASQTARTTARRGGDNRSESQIMQGFMGIYGDEKRATRATKDYMAKQRGGGR
jgi:hypothetical protein